VVFALAAANIAAAQQRRARDEMSSFVILTITTNATARTGR
jgi:hypothetical protein